MTFASQAPHSKVRRTATAILAVAFTTLVGAQQPTFRSSVDVTVIDVIVVDGAGRPITDLSAGDFQIRVDGRERRVVTARWMAQTAGGRDTPVPEVISGYSTNAGAIDGRLMLFAVDQPNLRFGSLQGVRPAIEAFIDRLEPSDRMAVVALGHGLSTPITTDRARVKAALAGMSGDIRAIEEMTNFTLSTAESLSIADHNDAEWVQVSMRECGAPPPPTGIPGGSCWDYLFRDVMTIAENASRSSSRTFQALRGLLSSLKQVNGPKTLVIISEGFLLADQGASVAVDLGSAAAAAQTTIYVLKVDDYTTDATTSRRSSSTIDDRRIRRDGAELLAAVARGQVFDALGAGDSALRQIEKEVAGYYLIGVESVPTDRNGKSHPVAVQVRRRGATVRARTQLVDAVVPVNTPNEDLVRALSSPFSNAGLPLRVTTFPFRDGDGPNIQILLHAEAGSGYASTTKVSLGYVISDVQGNIVTKSAGTAMLPPAIPGTPSPLFFTGALTLPPGEYTLKFAMTEGDRVGSVDHLIHALLPEVGSGRVSDLLVGGPPDDNEPQRPSVGYDVNFGHVQGYIEAYGRDVKNWMTTYEISANADGPPILSVGVAGRAIGDGRMVFSKTLPVSDLAPGKYYLRAALASNNRELKTVWRQFRISPVAPSVTAIAAAVFALAPTAVPLPVSHEFLAPRFVRERSLGDTLDRFRRIVSPVARTAFDAGSAAFGRGDDLEAKERFSAAVQPAVAGANNTAALSYLGAVAAASGNDEEAASIWQTSLASGSGLPEVYEWLGEALMRLGRVAPARTAFAEGAVKWPAEPRFHRSLAFIYADLGQSREALQALAAYVSQRPNDLEALRIAVEWAYRAHATGVVASAEEKALARRWVELYERGNGPNPGDLRGWLQLLENGGASDAAPPGPI